MSDNNHIKLILKSTYLILILFLINCSNEKRAEKMPEVYNVDCSKVQHHFENLTFDQQSVVEFSNDVQQISKDLNEKEAQALITGVSSEHARAYIVACLMKIHPSVDSVTVSKSGKGLSIYDGINNEWLNILVK